MKYNHAHLLLPAVLAASLLTVPAGAAERHGDPAAKAALLDLGRLDARHTIGTPGSATTREALARRVEEFRVSTLTGASPRRAATTETPTSTPTLTAPSTGDVTEGEFVVTALSGAAQVRFEIASFPSLTKTVPVTDGSANTTLDGWGLSGATTVLARDCDEAGACADSADEVAVEVANPAITLSSPSEGETVGSSLVAAAQVQGGGARFQVDGVTVGEVADAPYQLDVDTSALGEGRHELSVVGCSSDFTVCRGPGDTASFDVSTELSPELARATPALISPNGDGRRDKTTVTYSLDEAQSVSWSVLRGSTVVRGPVTLGTQGAGEHSFVFNGKGNGGATLTTGGYTVLLETRKQVGDSALQGRAELGLLVDVTPAVARALSATPATFYPVRDSYRDSARLGARLSEQVSLLSVEVRTKTGKLVRKLEPAGRSGAVAVAWNGRRTDGALAPAGAYRYRFVLRDLAGNASRSAYRGITLSHKRLVKNSAEIRVTPRASLVGTAIGPCSEVVTPGRRGWRGSFAYLSNVYGCGDTSGGEDVALTKHGVKLRSAVKYGRIRVDAYGARHLRGYPDVAVLLYVDERGSITEQGRLLGAAERWYPGPWRNGENYVNSVRRLRWWAGTVADQYYDIRYFRVKYVYWVLR